MYHLSPAHSPLTSRFKRQVASQTFALGWALLFLRKPPAPATFHHTGSNPMGPCHPRPISPRKDKQIARRERMETNNSLEAKNNGFWRTTARVRQLAFRRVLIA